MIIKSAVIGDPIAHSLSPKLHNFLLEKYKIDGSYTALKVSKEELTSSIKSLVEQGFTGFNVTIPHKEEMFRLCDHLSKSAQLTGAVNTVVVTENKKLFGHNSDIAGFLDNLTNSFSDFNLLGKSSFVVGAGGAARAVLCGLIKSGVKQIFVTNRNQSRVDELLKNFSKFLQEKNCELKFLDRAKFENYLSECDLLINTTSLGMNGQQALQLDLRNLPKSAIVYDIVYKPLMTQLLINAQARGNRIVTGIGMLVYQALVGFEMWFKQKPETSKELFEFMISESAKT